MYSSLGLTWNAKVSGAGTTFDHFPSAGDGLFGFAFLVAGRHFHLLAFDTTGGVDLLDPHLGDLIERTADTGRWPRQGNHLTNQPGLRRLCRSVARQYRCDHGGKRNRTLERVHEALPVSCLRLIWSTSPIV